MKAFIYSLIIAAVALSCTSCSGDGGKSKAAFDEGRKYMINDDYAKAEQAFIQSEDNTNNNIAKLLCEISLMQVYEQTSQNKLFYTHREKVRSLFKRINEDKDELDQQWAERYVFADILYKTVQANYFIGQAMLPRAGAILDELKGNEYFNKDSISLVAYSILQSKCISSDTPEQLIEKLDQQAFSLLLSRRLNNTHFIAVSEIEMAKLLALPNNFAVAKSVRSQEMSYTFPGIAADSLPDYLAHDALKSSIATGSKSLQVEARIALSQSQFQKGEYANALKTLQPAREILHKRHIPELEASMAEQLSRVYAALNRKKQSDYFRNIYLNILSSTRQDNIVESQYDILSNKTDILERTVLILAVFTVLLVILLISYRKSWGRSHARRVRELETVLKGDTTKKKDSSLRHSDKMIAELAETISQWQQGNQKNEEQYNEKLEELREQIAALHIHTDEETRLNVELRAKTYFLESFIPYIERIIYELNHIKNNDSQARLGYISQLVALLNRRNTLLADWITINSGSVSPRIETFKIKELFDILSESEILLKTKGIKLDIQGGGEFVKADKALTLFMLNTLADNARKNTDNGGTISIESKEKDDYIEISVSDNGHGMSAEDLESINNGKMPQKHTGHGFGLLNCHGIIEKYKKSGKIFSVCTFGAKGREPHGTQFFFRLPRAVARLVAAIVIMSGAADSQAYTNIWNSGSDQIAIASAYADSAYYSNVNGTYANTLNYVDSAFYYINTQLTQNSLLASSSLPPLTTFTNSYMVQQAPEVKWFNAGILTDYRLILDLRNETAVTCLALHLWDQYEYNNTAYRELYRLVTHDAHLDLKCSQLITRDRSLSFLIAFIIITLIAMVFAFYFFYFRKKMILERDLRQLLEINQIIVKCKDIAEIPDSILPLLQEIYPLRSLHINIDDETSNMHRTISSSEPETDGNRNIIAQTAPTDVPESLQRTIPLSSNGESNCFGSLTFIFNEEVKSKESQLINAFVAEAVSTVTYSNIVSRNRRDFDIKTMSDEMQACQMKYTQLHIQNQLIINSLSTIKHETMYYPTLLASYLQGDADVTSLLNTTKYYSNLFNGFFEMLNYQRKPKFYIWSRITADETAQLASDTFAAAYKGQSIDFTAHSDSESQVIGNAVMLGQLFYCFAQIPCKSNGGTAKASLTIKNNGDRLQFTYSDSRTLGLGTGETSPFSPDAGCYPLLVAKQILRLHDEARQNAHNRISLTASENSWTISFTLKTINI